MSCLDTCTKIYIQNLKYGYAFIAHSDMRDYAHLVEARPDTSDGDKALPKFQFEQQKQSDGTYLLKGVQTNNMLVYGIIDAYAKSGTDYFVRAIEFDSTPASTDGTYWIFEPIEGQEGSGYYIRNEFGCLFAAYADTNDGDHDLELRPYDCLGSDDLQKSKFQWQVFSAD